MFTGMTNQSELVYFIWLHFERIAAVVKIVKVGIKKCIQC